MFIQRDPIGLLGGVNVYQYAPNPIHWVDVFGLAKVHKNSKNAKGNFSLYAIWSDDTKSEMLKIGKADADDIMPTNGRVRRAHNSLRQAQKLYPNAIMEIIEELGQTTTGKAEAVEANVFSKISF